MNSNITTLLQNSSCSAAPMEELLTQAQQARMLGITRRTLSTWVSDQVVPMIKIKGFCRFDYQKVRAALEQYERPALSSQKSAPSSN